MRTHEVRTRRTEVTARAVRGESAGRTSAAVVAIGAETEAEDPVGRGGEGGDGAFGVGDRFGTSFAEIEDLRGVCKMWD